MTSDQFTGESGQSDDTAAAPAVDTEAIISAIKKEFDPRFSGLTTLIDNKIAPLAAELNELKNAGLSDDEREQLAVTSAQQRAAALERENALLKMRQDKPASVGLVLELEAAESLEDQLAIIEKHLGAAAAANVQQQIESDQSEAGANVSDNVDPNNPARKDVGTLDGPMTDELADRILKDAGPRAWNPTRIG